MNDLKTSAELNVRIADLTHMEARFVAIFRASPIPCVMSTFDGILLDVNDAFEKSVGYSREEAVGKSALDLNLWVTFEERDAFKRAVVENGLIRDYRCRFRRRDGQIRFLNCSVTIVEAGDVVIMVSQYVDETERLAAEESLRTLNLELELRVKARTVELQRAYSSLKAAQDGLIEAERIASLGAMVVGISHELNTPVGNLVSITSALEHRLEEFSAQVVTGQVRRKELDCLLSDGKEMVQLAVRASARSADLICRFKQLAEDQVSEQRRNFSVKEVVGIALSAQKPPTR